MVTRREGETNEDSVHIEKIMRLWIHIFCIAFLSILNAVYPWMHFIPIIEANTHTRTHTWKHFVGIECAGNNCIRSVSVQCTKKNHTTFASRRMHHPCKAPTKSFFYIRTACSRISNALQILRMCRHLAVKTNKPLFVKFI